jgi:hypothetical protein
MKLPGQLSAEINMPDGIFVPHSSILAMANATAGHVKSARICLPASPPVEFVNDTSCLTRYECAMSQRTIDRSAELEPDTAIDRRRAGRRNDFSADLIPLLRDALRGVPEEDRDQLDPARGIVVWLLVSIMLWLLAAWLIFR